MKAIIKFFRWLWMMDEKVTPDNMEGRAVWLVYGGSLRREK